MTKQTHVTRSTFLLFTADGTSALFVSNMSPSFKDRSSHSVSSWTFYSIISHLHKDLEMTTSPKGRHLSGRLHERFSKVMLTYDKSDNAVNLKVLERKRRHLLTVKSTPMNVLRWGCKRLFTSM